MSCRLCGSSMVESLIDFGMQPIVHDFLSSGEDEYEKYPFTLEGCRSCCFLQLADPLSPDILYKNYFTVSSWKFQPHTKRLISVMEAMCKANVDSKIIEIGCNDGTFLQELQENGYKTLLGVEPTNDAFSIAQSKGLEVLHTFLGSSVAADIIAERGRFDILVTRQVLEHISDLADFGCSMRSLVVDDGYLVIEVPDASLNLDTPDYTLWEEHVNYFTLETLKRYLNQIGFELLHSESIMFSGKCLTAIAQKRAVKVLSDDYIYQASLWKKIERFRDTWPIFKQAVGVAVRAAGSVAIYGAGSRSSFFVNSCDIGDCIKYYVDDQKEKQGYYVPGSSVTLPVLDSSVLNDDDVALCLLGVNTECENKVLARHKNYLAKGGVFKSILPPSGMLLDVWNQV